MALKYSYGVIVSSLLVIGSTAYLATSTCKGTPECLKESIQAALPAFIRGSPELGTEPMDPFEIKKLVLTLPGNLKIEFINGTSKGLRKCIIDYARMIDDTIDLQFRCNLTIKGQYKSSGSLLMFTIDGEGDSLIKCRNVRVQCLAKLGSIVQEDGKKHLEIKSVKTRHSFDGQVYYHLTNLFKGNPQIGDMVVEFMNRNWRMVAEEFGKPIVDFGMSSVVKNIKQLFRAIPQEQIIGTNNIIVN